MAVNKDEFGDMFAKLDEKEQRSVIDFMQYLVDRKKTFDWEAWDESLPTDDEPLSNEVERQFKCESIYESWEDVKRELQR
jgi:hypothetical protein